MTGMEEQRGEAGRLHNIVLTVLVIAVLATVLAYGVLKLYSF